ncbi:MAG: acetyl-CoA carboxylase carboxyltransferase subunit alpha, partial [candidate division Zixibacteria bacterium]|nr:acetyl-CoA carboxylase carboxyltransferase subunit alpha [candidate division Zixibacteria bacterium]
KLTKLRNDIFSKLSRLQRVQLARHPRRPYLLDYVTHMTTDFVELHGDRRFSDDKAMVGGWAKLDGQSIMLVGQQKGRNTKQKLYRNFGMANPEGYRKAERMFLLAEKFNRPVVCLIDTPGAYPGIGGEERGQAEAIAHNLLVMSRLRTPIVCVIIGEGASGGALGIGIGDRILMMENSWYSVISPEGCAAILWRDAAMGPQAAEALKVTSEDCMRLGVIDKIIPEPVGGAHVDPEGAAQVVKREILAQLKELAQLSHENLLQQRLDKFRRMGKHEG